MRDLDPASAVEELTRRDDVVLIDVRTPAEHRSGHVAGSRLIDWHAPDFADQVAGLPRDRAYRLYCRSGNRSGHAARLMTQLGFPDVANVGGFEDLARAGADVAR